MTKDIETGDRLAIRVSIPQLRRNVELGAEFDRQLGRAMQAWAWTSSALVEVFIAVTGMPQHLAYRLFDKVRSDRTQRDIVLEMARAGLGQQHELVVRLTTIVREIDHRAAQRNTLAHALFSLHTDEDGQTDMAALDGGQFPDGVDAITLAKSLGAELRSLNS